LPEFFYCLDELTLLQPMHPCWTSTEVNGTRTRWPTYFHL